MKTDPTFWILARASGLTAYALLTASVLMGLSVKARPFRSLKAATVTDLHRFVSTLALGSLAVHGGALVLDRTVPISLQALVVPGLATYRPVWTGLGVVAAELAVLVVVSFSLRKRIGTRNWRRLHWATYATFAAAAIHGIVTGTDTAQPWALGLYGATIGAVVAATVYRAFAAERPARPAATRDRGPGLRPGPHPRPHPSQGGTASEHLPHRDRPVAV